MTRASGLRLLVVIGVLVLGIVLILREISSSEIAGQEAATAVSGEATTASTPGPALASSPEEPARAPEEPTRAAIPGDGATVSASISDAELAEAVWVEGRVVFPEGTPLDEEVEIVARGRKFAGKELHRARASADGRFRVAFEKRTKQGWLDLEARYLHLDEAHPIRPAAQDAQAIVLEPKLGGRLVGRCAPSAAAANRGIDFGSASVSLSGGLVSATTGEFTSIQRNGRLDHELRFELGGIPAKHTFTLLVTPRGAAEIERQIAALNPGETRTIDLELVPGVTLRGRVQEPSGEPLAGVGFALLPSGAMFARQPAGVGRVMSGADGRFEITGIAARDWELEAKLAGFVPARIDLVDLAEGATRDGLVLVLSRGSSISGRVTWFDASPASGAVVEAHELDTTRFRAPQRTSAGADGTFTITGLTEGAFRLTARAQREEERARADAGEIDAPRAADAAGSAARAVDGEGLDPASGEDPRALLAGRKKPRDGRVAWEAVADVTAGTSGVELVLQSGASLAGRVLDDLGRPLADFEVSAQPADRLQAWSTTEGRIARTFRGAADGGFVLDGLREGDWDVRAEGPGHVDSGAKRVRVPHAGGPVEIRLSRAARLAGTVVDPAGLAVPGARVELVASSGVFAPIRPGSKGSSSTSDEQGRFGIPDAKPGPQHVIASAEGWGSSEPLPVDVAPGEPREGLVIALRHGGRLTGEVFDESGAPDPQCRVFVAPHGAAGASLPFVGTDEQGRFEFGTLAPGKYSVNAFSTDSYERVPSTDRNRARPLPRQATVEVVAGETTHVLLGAPEKEGVRVHGVVRSSGEPVAGVDVHLMQVGRGESRTKSDGSGRYELRAAPGGRVTLSVSDGSVTNGTTVAIPADAEEHEVDLELPGAAIHGRVVGPDGRPIAGVHVTLRVDRSAEARSARFSYGRMASEDDGRFAFDHVMPGTYRLQAGSLGGFGLRSGLGIAIRERIEVGAQDKVEVELRLSAGRTVEGVVLDPENRPAIGAAVFGRGEDGSALHNAALATTDSAGRFRIDGLPEGRASFIARTSSSASEESAPIVLQAEGASEVELRLRPATRLYVVIEEAGKKVGAQVRVYDASGRECSGYWAAPPGASPPELPGQFAGVFVPGTYRVVATNHGGKKVEQTLVLNAEEKAGVTLTYE